MRTTTRQPGTQPPRDAFLSLVHDADLVYPDSHACFSPSEPYPEYPFAQLAQHDNGVYRAVRQCFVQAGLDLAHFGTPAWNPLRDIVAENSRVFVLCNFVHNKRMGETDMAFSAKCTHASVIRAVVDYLLIAVGPNGSVRFGNAPVQSCNWQKVTEETGAATLAAFYQAQRQPVALCDLRLFVAQRDLVGRMTHIEERAGTGIARDIDLGTNSLLDHAAADPASFRVSEYDSRRTQSFHARGRHVYTVHQYILDADVVFSIPKLKTHQKVGLTCGVKGCVGGVAHKDCLAHHRSGPPEKGGDEYPADRWGVKQWQSRFHDHVWHTPPASFRGQLLRVVDRAWRRWQGWRGTLIAGGWWGNDTAWRMALDLARVIACVDAHGVLHAHPVRPHYVLVDGVVGGQGNGPLRPQPAASHLLLFSNDLFVGDYAAALAIGFDPTRLPIIGQGVDADVYPVIGDLPAEACLNGEPIPLSALAGRIKCQFEPPPGWKNYVELP